MRYEGQWSDIGTWRELSTILPETVDGNTVLSECSTNTHIINDTNIPIVGIGLEDIIVAVGDDGILITSKSESDKLKTYLGELAMRPKFEKRIWGEYKVLDCVKGSLTKRITVNEGCNISYQTHEFREEVWTVTEGSGEFILDGKLRDVGVGDVLIIPVGSKHSIRAKSTLTFVEVQLGEVLEESDIMRYETNWNRILEYVK